MEGTFMNAPISARLACGCTLAFKPGVEGSPVTVSVDRKAEGCPLLTHVSGLPVFDHREALRPSTRHQPPAQTDYEES
jgi:hypothetical protein